MDTHTHTHTHTHKHLDKEHIMKWLLVFNLLIKFYIFKIRKYTFRNIAIFYFHMIILFILFTYALDIFYLFLSHLMQFLKTCISSSASWFEKEYTFNLSMILKFSPNYNITVAALLSYRFIFVVCAAQSRTVQLFHWFFGGLFTTTFNICIWVVMPHELSLNV